MLTTAAAPFEDMGAKAVQLLLDRDHTPGEHLVPMPIRVRGSVKVPEVVATSIPAVNVETDWAR